MGSDTWVSDVDSVVSSVTGPLKPAFPPIKKEKLADGSEVRKIPVPSHRYTPLKENWMKIFEPIVEHLKLQVRFNLKTRNVEVRTCKDTEDRPPCKRLQTSSGPLSSASKLKTLWLSSGSTTCSSTASRSRMSRR